MTDIKPTQETKGEIHEENVPCNITGQIMKRISKKDKILVIEVNQTYYFNLLHTLGFDVSYHNLAGEDEFDFESKTFTRLICVDALSQVDQQDEFIKDCLSKLTEGGLGLFFFHAKYLNDELKLYLKNIKCDNVIRMMPSRLDCKELDTCLIEIVRCKKHKEVDVSNIEIRSLADIVKENKSNIAS